MLTYYSQHLQERLKSDLSSFRNSLKRIEKVIHSLSNPLELPIRLDFSGLGSGLFLWRRRQERTRRLILYCEMVEEHHVIVFLDVLAHEDKSYEKFYNFRATEEKRLKALVSYQELEEFVRKLQHEEQQATLEAQLPLLPIENLSWVMPAGPVSHYFLKDKMIFESPAWSHFLGAKGKREREKFYRYLREQILSQQRKDKISQFSIQNSGFDILSYRDEEQGRTFIYIKRIDQKLNNDLLDIKKFTSEQILDHFAQISSRAYPAERLKNPSSCATSIEINQPFLDPYLPLSSEEFRFLDSLTSFETIPLFLDGAAGSGKSTLLTYFMSNILNKKRENDEIGYPLFITYSDILRNETQKRVSHHLIYHYDWQEKETSSISLSFQTTKTLFFSLVSSSIADKFSLNKYCNFARFHDWAEKTFKNWSVKVSFEEAWFIIRSFIKGYANITFHKKRYQPQYFTLEEFKLLPEDRKDGVSYNSFEETEKMIWPRYKKWLENEKLWDDQDLTLAALSSFDKRRKQMLWNAVICDESQDLTKNDFRLLFRLLEATQYNLGTQYNVALPFIFAADPLQTVNPSGFKWTGFTSSFYEETSLLLGKKRAIARRQKTLQWNYRAGRSLVKLFSSIQNWRHQYLHRYDAKPVQAWHREKGLIKRFVLTHANKDEFKIHINNVSTILFPCWEGEIESFIQHDEFLQDLLTAENYGIALSPVTAKGLEFDTVLLYGFGTALSSLYRTQKNKDKLYESKELDFFLNFLYVAVTRARRILYFVDSAKGDRCLWHESGILKDCHLPIEKNFDILVEHASTEQLIKQGDLFLTKAWEENSASYLTHALARYEKAKSKKNIEITKAWQQIIPDKPLKKNIFKIFRKYDQLSSLEYYLWKHERLEDFAFWNKNNIQTDYGQLGVASWHFEKQNRTITSSIKIAEAIIHIVQYDELPQDFSSKRMYNKFLKTIIRTFGVSDESSHSEANIARAILKILEEACEILYISNIELSDIAYMTIRASLGDYENALNILEGIEAENIENFSKEEWKVLLFHKSSGFWWIDSQSILTEMRKFRKDEALKTMSLEEQKKLLLTTILKNPKLIDSTRKYLPQILANEPSIFQDIALEVLSFVLEKHHEKIKKLTEYFQPIISKE